MLLFPLPVEPVINVWEANEDNERLPNVEEVKKPDPFAEFGASIAIDEDEFPF